MPTLSQYMNLAKTQLHRQVTLTSLIVATNVNTTCKKGEILAPIIV